MILTCPACATRYQVDEAKFPPQGRQVRCAKCGNNWHQPGPEPEIAPEPTPADIAAAPEAAPAPVRIDPPQPVSRPRAVAPAAPKERTPLLPMVWVALGWIGLIAVVLLIGLSAVRYRQEITVIWPQSASVYSRLGMKVDAQGIDFDKVDYHRESEDGQVVLAVTGQIVNHGTRELPVPQTVRVTLSDASNHELYHWNFTPEAQTLRPGQSIPFLTRLSSPPATARHLEVRFSRGRQVTREILFSAEQIAAGVEATAKKIARAPLLPDIAMPVLVGGFIFAADLVRALSRQGVNLDIEMLWLRSYGDKRVASAISMIAGPSEQIAGRHVLVIDGVLDLGRTIKKAVSLIEAAGAASVQVVVALDKKRPDAEAKADYVAFETGNDFVIGYGMDDAGKFRSLPYIGKVT